MVFLLFFLVSTAGRAEEVNPVFVGKRNELVRAPFENIGGDQIAYSVNETPDPDSDSWTLSLQECTRLALDGNADVSVSYLTLDSARLSVIQQEAAFDTNYAFSFHNARSRTSTITGTTSLGESVPVTAGATKAIFTGGTLSAGMSNARTGRKHTHVSQFSFGFSQPLLSGFGPDVTYVPLHLARNNYKISVYDLKSQLITTLSSAQSAYWDILRAREILKTRELAYRQAKEFVDQNERALQLGNRTKTDVLQAKASAAQREQEVLVAENALFEAEDLLKKILNVRDLSVWNKRVQTSENINLDISQMTKIDLKEALKVAFENRADYKKAEMNLANDRLTEVAAKDKLLPDLDFEYNLDFGGTGLSWRESMDRLKTGDHPDWEVALTFTYPWGDRSDQADYQKSVNTIRARQEGILSLVLQILKEVRSAVRNVNVNMKRVEVADLAYELQKEKLEAEEKKYSLGISTSFEVLSFQEDLANSGVTRIGAIVDYHKSLITLWQTMGISLEKNNVRFEETGKDTSQLWFS